MRRRLPFIIFAAALTGCSESFYERDADRQVTAIVKQREQQALGYQPAADVKVEPSDRNIAPSAYAKIPVSPIPPPGSAQVEEQNVEVEYAPLGPKRFDWPEGAPVVRAGSSYDSVDSLIRERLRLGPPSPGDRPVRMDFFQALRFGVEHSRAYQDQAEDLYLSALNVTLQRHLFEPRPFAGASLAYSGGQRDVNYRSALTSTLRAGVRQKLPMGGELVAQGLVDFVSAIGNNATSGEDAAVVLTGSVPLLRGAGMVNLEPLIAGERGLVYQVRSFENFRREFVITVATQYFRLINLQQSVLDRRLNYQTYQTLTERSRALYAAGRVAFLELQRSLQELLTAEDDFISARETYFAALDDFKLLLGMSTEQEVEITPVALDVDVPENVSEEEAVKMAMKYRLDLRTARDRVEDAQRGVGNAKNDLLPDLTLSGRAELGNRPGESARSIDAGSSTYSARLDLELPIDRVAERNQYRASLINVRRAQRDLEDLRDRVVSDVRESIRLLRQSQLSLQIQRQGIDLAQKRRENAYELLRSGKSTSTRDLVEAQNSLLRARDRYESARATQQIQVLRFLRNSGTLRLDPSAGAVGHAMDKLDTEGRSNNALSPK
ncbi:MAG TPA: TolC family protein [Tepidisphaeraceae bacterium]|nr:TolC family protein [Tepidisphaeraceae bacterium]